MAALERGLLADLNRKNSPTPRDSVFSVMSSNSEWLLSKGWIPISLAIAEGKPGGTEEPDTLVSQIERLEALGYEFGAAFIRGENQSFNDTGVFTDDMQKNLVDKAKVKSRE